MTARPQPSVLVVEDEAELRQTIAESLTEQGFVVAQSADGADAFDRLKGFAYDAIVIDLRLPDADGLDVLDAAVGRYPDILAVMVTGFGGVAEAVSAMRRGAIDFLIKPFQLSQLARILTTSLEQRRLREENADLRAQLRDRYRFDSVIGHSAPMRHVFSTLELVAPMNSTVLIQGETGTGKELIARTLHHNSPRADQRFVAFNAAAIPEPLAEAELFGHSKGAFTGAVQAKPGKFELAHRGTLFLDEVGDLPLDSQATLLRVLQDGLVERVGSTRPIPVDVRIVAATNVDLDRGRATGAFRADLFYRLSVFPIRLPALRDRRSDIPLLATFFAGRCADQIGRTIDGFTPDALERLVSHEWPGNVRELQNVVERAVLLTTGRLVRPDAIALQRAATASFVPVATAPTPTPAPAPMDVPAVTTLDDADRHAILRALESSGWRVSGEHGAARALGVKSTTLHSKMKRLGIQRPRGTSPTSADDASGA